MQARPITAVIAIGALGVRVATGGSGPAAGGIASPSAASENLQSGVSLAGLRCRQAMASAPPGGTPRQLLANSWRQVNLIAFICCSVGAGAASFAGAAAAAGGATMACFGAVAGFCARCGLTAGGGGGGGGGGRAGGGGGGGGGGRGG